MATVLVVEDDRNIQALLSEALRAEGYEVRVERDGAQAVDHFGRQPPDALILDVLLPGLNGFQVAERIRTLPGGQTVPILMLSGAYRGQKTSELAHTRLGVLSYVEKPFQLEQILGPLRTALQPAPAAQRAPARTNGEGGLSPRPPGVARLAMKVSVSERGLHWVFGELFRRRAKGVLALTRPGQEMLVYFRDGEPVAVRRRGAAHRFASILVRDHVIHPGDVPLLRQQAVARGLRIGDAAVLLEYLPADDLKALEARRTDAALVDAFGWADGEARFFLRERLPSWTPRQPSQPIALLVYHLVRDGLPSVALMRELATKLEQRPVVARQQSLGLLDQLPARERDALFGLEGQTTIREVIAKRPVDDVGALLIAAMCLGLILPSGTAPGAQAAGLAPMGTAPPPRATEPIQRAERAAPPRPAIIEVVPERRAQDMSSAQFVVESPGGAKQAAGKGTDDDPAQIAELKAKLETLETQDHWAALGLARPCAPADARAAYHKLAKSFHPDRFALAGPMVRDLADKIFARITEAYRILLEPALTAKYEEQLKRKPGDVDASEKLARVVGAEKAFRAGEIEFRRRNYSAALAQFEEAVRLYHEEGEYHAWLGYTLALAMPNDHASQKRALWELDLAKKQNPNCTKAFLFQGFLYKIGGKTREAEGAFEKVLEIDPKDIEAARELRLINMRREKAADPKKRR